MSHRAHRAQFSLSVTNAAFPAKGKMRDCGVHRHFTPLQHLQGQNPQRGKKKKKKNQNGKKHRQQATGCTWPREGWLVGCRKWREKERKARFWITAVFGLQKKSCFEAQRDILLFFPRTVEEAEERFATARVKCGCGGDSCAVSISAITLSCCFHVRETLRVKMKSRSFSSVTFVLCRYLMSW